MDKYQFDKLISTNRFGDPSTSNVQSISEFYLDRSRVLYCSSFRRLQQKAQVFSLEPNASVRTRLTHSLEVSDIGRTIANKIADALHSHNCKKTSLLGRLNMYNLVAIVETACLLHDIGNPPFGHFGEAAIRDWANRYTDKRKEAHQILNQSEFEEQDLLDQLMEDFYSFDGNPQGFRTVTKLQTERGGNGLDLTYSTLMCMLKYSRIAGEEVDYESEGISEDIVHKAGYFQSEQELVKELTNKMDIKPHCRYPFTYIMEAADDIAYCMSDIADGIEKGILTEKTFIEKFNAEWKENYHNSPIPVSVPDPRKELKGFNIDISEPWTKAAIDEAVTYFMKHLDKVYNGKSGSLINKDGKMGRVFEIIRNVSKKYLYTSIKAENIEITGYAVITGILNRFEKLLSLPEWEFSTLIEKRNLKEYPYETRLFHLLGIRNIQAYQYALQKYDKKDVHYKTRELWLRIHLIIDQISGMTDDFALETYQMLEGIQVVRS